MSFFAFQVQSQLEKKNVRTCKIVTVYNRSTLSKPSSLNPIGYFNFQLNICASLALPNADQSPVFEIFENPLIPVYLI